MPTTWVLTDVASRKYVETLALGPKEVPGTPAGFAIRKERLRGGMGDGVDVLHVDNGGFAFAVLPTRGMSIWKAWENSQELGWQSPVRGPVHPSFVNLGEPSGLGWLDGFDELFVRCGLESNGAPEFERGRLKYPLHGRIGNKAAGYVDVTVDPVQGEIMIRGVVEESRFHFAQLRLGTVIRTKFGEPGFRVVDEVTNFSANPGSMQLLYHINFGLPLLDAGSRAVLPARTIVPRNGRAAAGINAWDSYLAPIAGFEEQVYFFDLLADKDGRTRALLKNAHGTRAASVVYDAKALPCFSLWKNTSAVADGYVTGLEPATNFPNPRDFEEKNGRVVPLKPDEKRTFEVAVELHRTADEVKAAEKLVADLQARTKPQISPVPLPTWCAP